MQQAYLFVHFREMCTPDGEQLRFALSRDGFHWEAVNDGRPLLWAYYGDKGVRDFTIVRSRIDGRFYILATDLSLAYTMRTHREGFWPYVSRHGSKCLALWESDDLIHWSEQRLVQIGNEDFGCLWAPDALYCPETDDYLMHWSSSHASNAFGQKAIFGAHTRDFKTFTAPKVLYRKPDSEVIDSAIYEEDGRFYMFLKSHGHPNRCMLLTADSPEGEYTPIDAFSRSMEQIEEGKYEAPTAVRLADGRWCLFLDFYGASGAGQGYVPFVADNLRRGEFRRADEEFSFPYGFKHGTILTITPEEYDRIRSHDWGRIMGW